MKAPLKLLLSAFGVAVAVACSSGNADDKSNETCEPGAEIYCRCENLDEGSQFCKDDGSGYERCEPCFDDYEEDGDYGFPEDDGSPPPPRDAGRDAADTRTDSCDNGTVDDGESCDDGNQVADDGCDRCVAGGNPLSGSVCPGVVVHLWGAPYQLAGSTSAASPAHTGIQCDGQTGGGSPDRVYALVPHAAGSIRVEVVSSSFETALYARTKCDEVSDATQVACTLGTTFDIPNVTADKTVYLTVDGNGANKKGDYTLQLTLVPGS